MGVRRFCFAATGCGIRGSNVFTRRRGGSAGANFSDVSHAGLSDLWQTDRNLRPGDRSARGLFAVVLDWLVAGRTAGVSNSFREPRVEQTKTNYQFSSDSNRDISRPFWSICRLSTWGDVYRNCQCYMGMFLRHWFDSLEAETKRLVAANDGTSAALTFLHRLGVNCQAENLGEALFHAVFQGGGDVVDFGDGQAAVHGAVAGDQDFVIHAADVHFVAVRQLVIFGLQRIQKFLHGARKFFHLLAAADFRAERLDVNIHQRARIGFLPDVLFELGGAAVRFAQAGALVHFQVQLDEEAVIELVRGKFVHGEAATLRDGANGFEDVFVGLGARLHVHHHVRGNDLRDAFFHGVAGGVGLLQAGGARHADGHIHEIALAGAAHAHAFGLQHAFGLVHGGFDAFAQAVRSNVQQRIGRAFAEPRANPDDHAGDAESRDGVQRAQPDNSVMLAQPRTGDAQNDDEGAPHVGGKMQCVRFEGFAGIFLRHAIQTARADEINSHAQHQNQDGLQAGAQVRGVKEQPLKGFPDDVHSGEKQERGLYECGETFYLAVTVEVVRVGGLICNAHRKIGNHRRRKI